MRKKGKKAGVLCLFVLLLLCGCGKKTSPQEVLGPFLVHFIDVGKGDCILLQSTAYTVMIDTGYEETAKDVLKQLEAWDITQIDVMIVTHFDKDHEGGAEEILSSLPVGSLYLPDYEGHGKRYERMLSAAEENDVPIKRLSEDIYFTADEVVYEIYVSGIIYNEEKENDNDMSLIVSAVYGKDRYLFAGDMEKQGIKAYLARHGSARYDVLKMPHHGREESNTAALIATIAPRYAVITDSKEKPADNTVRQILTAGAVEYYTSAENGTLTITGNGTGEYEILTQR